MGALLLWLLGSSGCTLLWLFQSDPEGLPCEIDANGVGSCLEGYACVSRGDDTLPVCLKEAARGEGEACESGEQCESGLTCASAWAGCGANADDPNCSLVNSDEKELRCRPTCRDGDNASCGVDGRCFPGELGSFCQRGVCATDSDCRIDGDSRFCLDELRNAGASGVCLESCDPLSCGGGLCPDCTGLDGQPDPNSNCVPLLDEATLTVRTMCDVAGTLSFLQPCERFGEPCAAGSFCNDFLAGQAPYCAQWCLFPNGAPTCDGDAFCVQAFGEVGYCVPAG